jgi:large subunit ribosomal protein L31e
MAEKTKKPISKIEREYVIPLREKIRSVPIYKKTPKAVKTVKEFVAKHMKVTDRDLNKVGLDKYLNEALWFRGIRKPINKIKVKVVKEGDLVRVYALDLPSKINYKKLREERNSVEQKVIGDKAKKEIEERKKAEEEAELKEIQAEEEASGVPKEIAKEEAKLDVEETKKAEKVVATQEKEKEKAVEEQAQEEMKKEAKSKKTTPKSPKQVKESEKDFNSTTQGQ